MLPPTNVSPAPLAHSPPGDLRHGEANIKVSPRVMFGFLLAALATVLIGIATYWALEERASALERLGRARQSVVLLQNVMRTTIEAESGQRGFLLSGEPGYLAGYELAVAKMPEQLAALYRTLNEREALVQRHKELALLVDAKLKEIAQTVNLYRSGKREEALALLRTGQGQATMEKLLQVGEVFTTDLQQRAEQFRDEWRTSASWSTWVTVGGSALLLVLIGMAAAVSAREQATKARQSWVDRGVLGLGVELQGDHTLEKLGEMAMRHLANYMNAQVGAAYVVRGAQQLEIFGAYALDSQHAIGTVVLGEGLLGEALRSRALHHVREVPEGYMRVTSATGSATPRELLLMPAV
ncbi:MAG: CHASE3 domain-containing protein, partial [Giesbergeria sp.]